MGRTGFVIENGGLNSFIGTGKLFSDTEIDLLWRNLATDGKNVIGVIPNTNIVIEPFKRSDYKGFKSGMTSFPDGTHVWGPVETFGEVKEAVIGEEIKIFDTEAIRSSLQELSRQRLSVLRASVRHDQLIPIVNKAEAYLNLTDSSLLVTAAVLSVLPRVCRKKEVQVGLSVILVGSLLLAACNEALTQRPPAVKIATGTPTRIYPTEAPEPAFVPITSPTPKIAITPGNGGAGGPEFILGSEVDLQLAVKGEALFPADCTNKIGKDPDYNAFKQLLPGADVKGLVDSLRARLQPDTQRIDSLCIGENGWAIQVLNSNGEILWAKVDGGWFSHPNRILLNGGNITLESVGGARNNKFETRMVILNSQPWVVEFIKGTNYPQRYFNPAENAWREFSWNKFPGSEKLLGNPNLRIVDIKGDFSLNAIISTRAQEGGGGGFKVASSNGSKELNVLVNRPPKPNAFVRPQSEVTIQLKDGTKITAGYILPVTTTDSDIIQAKFRLDSNTIEIVFNGKVLKVIPAQGFLAGDKSQLSSGILSGRDGKTAEMELFVSTPNGGQQKDRENVKLSEMIPPTATVAATPKPQFTPVPPTAVKPTSSPLLTPFKVGETTYIPVSPGPCVSSRMTGVWLRVEGNNSESCLTGTQRNPGLDAAVESWFKAVKAQGFSAANYTAGIIITQSIDGLINGTGSFHYSSSQFPYDELDGRLAALPNGTKLAFSYKRSQGSSFPNQMTAYAQLP